MKILCLNCRGLGRLEAVQELRSLIELHRPWLVFLSETRLFFDNVDGLKRSLGMSHGLGVGCYGRGGGLALLWTSEILVQFQSYDKLHIDVLILDHSTREAKWRFMGFYGEARREQRHRSWECLRYLKDQSDLPWLCVGDFNECLEAQEQIGGQTRSERQMEGFREAIQFCGLSDLGYIGLPYTWYNRQQGVHNVKVRLDRGLACAAFHNMFNVRVWHVQTTESDHCSLVIECDQGRQRRRRGRRRFRYENMWRRGPSYTQTVETAWQQQHVSASMESLARNLGRIGSSLSAWDQSTFGSVRIKLAQLRKELEKVREQNIGCGPTRSERRLMKEISKLLSREEAMEKQRSRVEWLREGDRNTAFFQAKSKERAKSNRIVALNCPDGSLATEQQELEKVTREFYSDLFTGQENLELEPILDHVPRRVTDPMNDDLTKPFSEDEVEKALFMMGANKAPGPDGFTAGFYEYHWKLLGPSVTKGVLDFLNGGEMPEEVNRTTIVLIPKVKNPQDMKNFRPISLCNVLYKICSKVLANRLKLG